VIFLADFLGQYPVSLGSLSEACFPEDIQMAVKNMSEDKREKKGKKITASSDRTSLSCFKKLS
jgi:hypothetical protein